MLSKKKERKELTKSRAKMTPPMQTDPATPSFFVFWIWTQPKWSWPMLLLRPWLALAGTGVGAWQELPCVHPVFFPSLWCWHRTAFCRGNQDKKTDIYIYIQKHPFEKSNRKTTTEELQWHCNSTQTSRFQSVTLIPQTTVCPEQSLIQIKDGQTMKRVCSVMMTLTGIRLFSVFQPMHSACER